MDISAQNIIDRVYAAHKKPVVAVPQELSLELSLKAAKAANLNEPFDNIESELHERLVKHGADWFICLQSWALLVDLRTSKLVAR